MDPFGFGLNAVALSQNPELFARVMSAAGVSPQGMGTGFQLGPQAAASAQGLGQLMQPQATAIGNAGMVGAPPAPEASGLSALKGIQAPKAPAPIMNAGVSGSARPELGLQVGKGSQAIDAMMKMIVGQKQAQVPNLAQLLKGVG